MDELSRLHNLSAQSILLQAQIAIYSSLVIIHKPSLKNKGTYKSGTALLLSILHVCKHPFEENRDWTWYENNKMMMRVRESSQKSRVFLFVFVNGWTKWDCYYHTCPQ